LSNYYSFLKMEYHKNTHLLRNQSYFEFNSNILTQTFSYYSREYLVRVLSTIVGTRMTTSKLIWATGCLLGKCTNNNIDHIRHPSHSANKDNSQNTTNCATSTSIPQTTTRDALTMTTSQTNKNDTQYPRTKTMTQTNQDPTFIHNQDPRPKTQPT
jgi:hypothetical protein